MAKKKDTEPVRIPKKRRSKTERDRSTVVHYLYFDDLLACLESGWSPASTRGYLEDVHGDGPEVPGEMAIRRWRDRHLPTAKVIPPEFINEKLKGVDYKVDVLKHLSRMIPILEDRVARGLKQEMENFGGMPLPLNEGVVRTYLDALRDWLKVAQDLGIVKAPPAPYFDMRTQNLNMISPDAAKELFTVFQEIKKLGPMP